MRAEMEAFFEAPFEPLPALGPREAGHRRLELRCHCTSHDVDWLFSDRRYSGEPVLPGLAMIAPGDAERTVDGRTSRTVRHYLSSSRLTP